MNRWLFKVLFYLALKQRKEWFMPYLEELKASQYYSLRQLEQIQLKKLNKIIKHANENVEFYKGNLFDDIATINDITHLPLLEKDDIRTNPTAFMWRSGSGQRFKTSGGSTGAPVTILKDSLGMGQELAATWRGYEWAGVFIGDRQARFWGSPKSLKDRIRSMLIDFVCHRIRVTAFGYNDDFLKKALNRVENFNPDYFYGYVSILKDFSKFYRNQSRRKIKLKSVISTSEVLTDSDREFIEKTFGVKVFDEYGCGEVGTIAHECEHGSMHINSENMILEIIDCNGNNAKPGEQGEIVVTDLTNYSMPLIRYRLRDYGTLSAKECSCGRKLPVLEKIHGRQYDTLINKNEVSFHGEFFLYIIEDLKKLGVNIHGVQFLQKKNLDIEVLIVSDNIDMQVLSKFVEKRIYNDFDKNIAVSIRKVLEIPREESGKLRVVKRL